jgi:hypothetical protein
MEALSISCPDLTVQFPERRSECRTSMAIEIVLRGVDRWGKAFVEKTRTVDLSPTGAKAMMNHTVSPGSRLRVLIPHLDRTSWGTIAWVGEKVGNQQEIGISVDETSDFWGMQFTDVHETDVHETPQPTETVPVEPAMGATQKAEDSAMIPQPAFAPTLPSVECTEETKNSSNSSEAERANFTKLSNALQQLAQRAIEQSLQDALQHLNRQTAEIMRDMQEVIIRQTQDRVRQSVETALQQVEAAGRSAIKQSQTVWQQRIKAVTDSCQSRLEQNKKHGTTTAVLSNKQG